jgi:hexosaminidase
MHIKSFRYVALIVAALSLSFAAVIGEPQQTGLHLMPVPKTLVSGQGRLSIDGNFKIILTGYKDSRFPAAVARFLQRLQRKTGIPLSMRTNTDSSKATFEIFCAGAGERIQSARADESYSLDVTEQGARLAASSPIGILRGMETFLQLVDLDDKSFFVPAVQIKDEPRFCWRGLLIDVSRHWEPVDVIKRNLDAMAALKMNVLHWHLSDDQGFRVESRRFPKLHQIASEGNYYSQQEVQEIIAYARERGIRVIPEFDMPGHTTAWLVAYPELASAPGPYQIERAWGVFDPCMNPAEKRLYSFLNSFVDEMAELFPDEYFHIGGDEVNGKQWDGNSKIQSFKNRHHLKSNSDLQAYFNQRLQKILSKHGKKMIGWDEILHPDLPHSVMVQSWRGQSFLANSARRGYSGVLSYGYYLDHMRPASFHYEMDPLGKEAANLADNEKSRILGGEACMWAEFVTSDNIESRIWPRTAALAERLWSQPEIKDVEDMYRRLEYVNGELEALGMKHRAKHLEMLQRMAGNGSITPLKRLADLLKPTGLSVRRKTREYSSLIPLNRMVDAVLPESETARQFGDLVNRALSNQNGSAEAWPQARKLLSSWQEIAGELKPTVEQSFLLKEIGPASEMVSDLCAKGIQALDYVRSQQKPPDGWNESAALLIERAEKPQAEMLVAIAPPIKKLIEAANTIP